MVLARIASIPFRVARKVPKIERGPRASHLPPQQRDFCSSGGRLIRVSSERLDELLKAEVAYLSSAPVQPMNMRQILDIPPDMLAEFCRKEGPKRLAMRINLLEGLTGWEDVPELVQMGKFLHSWYRALTFVQMGTQDLKDLIKCIRTIRDEGRDVLRLVAAGMHKLQQNAPDKFGDGFLDRWLESFLLSRISTNLLADQLVARASQTDGGLGRPTGIINPRCNATLVCQHAAEVASKLCLRYTGHEPAFTVENYCAGVRGQKDTPCIFSYIPGYLRYIILELLKNSFKATVENASNPADIGSSPVRILVCRDEHRVAIMVSDRAGGIPLDVGDQVWSYMYGAAARGDSSGTARGDATDDKAPVATPLAGYGVGLPTSRLYARYLGGKLEVTSYPGYGTQAHVLLPRIDADQVEALPYSGSCSSLAELAP